MCADETPAFGCAVLINHLNNMKKTTPIPVPNFDNCVKKLIAQLEKGFKNMAKETKCEVGFFTWRGQALHFRSNCGFFASMHAGTPKNQRENVMQLL